MEGLFINNFFSECLSVSVAMFCISTLTCSKYWPLILKQKCLYNTFVKRSISQPQKANILIHFSIGIRCIYRRWMGDNSTFPGQAKYGIMLDFVLNTNMLCKILFLIGHATGISFLIKSQA